MNLPIAERELRVAARDRRTYRGRFVVCLIFGAVAVWVIWAFGRWGNPAGMGANVFSVMTMMAFMMVVMGAQVTADAISSEKREGTLGFLFLTNLRGYDIVVGKLAAYGLTSIYGLVAAIPVIALPLLIGGVPLESVAKTALGLLNTLFLALSLGLWVSSRHFEQKKAMGRAVQWMMFFWMGLPLLSLLLEVRYRQRELAQLVRLFSPVSQLSSAGPFAIGLTTANFAWAFLINHLMAWALLITTCLRLPHVWQDKPRESLKNRFLLWLDQLRYGTAEVRLEHRKCLLDRGAVYWLCGREVKAPHFAWAFIAVALASWTGIWLYFKYTGATWFGVGVPMVIVLQFIFFLRVVTTATEVIQRDRQTGALELLLSTRLTIDDVVRGHARNAVRVCAGPIIATYILGLLVTLGGAGQSPFESNDFFRVFFYLATMFAANLVGGFWTALWMAASARVPGQAGGLTMVRMILLPFIAFILLITFLAWLDFEPSGWTAFTLWWLLGLANAAYCGTTSRRKFYENIRTIAAERHYPGAFDLFQWVGRLWGSFLAGGKRPAPAAAVSPK